MNGIPSKIKTNATIFKVLGWIGIILSILAGLGMIIAGIAIGDEALIMFLIFGFVSLVFGIIGSLLNIFTASGILNKKGWAKILGIILAILMLPSIPIGTILGIILLINFFDNESKAWFEEGSTSVVPPPAPPTV